MTSSPSIFLEKRQQCSIIGCKKPYKGKGFCKNHFSQNWRKNNPEKVKKYHQEWAEKNLDYLKKYNKNYGPKYYQKNKEKILAQGKKLYQENHSEKLKRAKELRQKNKFKINKKSRENYPKIKKQKSLSAKKCQLNRKTKVIYHYSDGKMICNKCGMSGIDFLTIDHLKGKKLMGHDNSYKGSKLYIHLAKNDFPPYYQVLCWNCNWLKYRNERRKYSNSKKCIQTRKHDAQVKLAVFSKISKGIPECNCCRIKEIGVLSVDHKYGRKNSTHTEGLTGLQLWNWIKSNSYPPEFQILCFNCNCAKGKSEICPHKKINPFKIRTISDVFLYFILKKICF